MKFSLVLGTLNRVDTLKCCLSSLLNQRYEDYEIIIIDQSDDDATERYVNSMLCNKIIYRHVAFKGLSKARNEAMRLLSGDYFCLVDDDGFYSPDYLYNAASHLNEIGSSRVILSGYIWDTLKNKDFLKYPDSYNGKRLPFRYIVSNCPSASLFLPSSLMSDIGYFDEQFGVGAVYGAGEETDYLLRAFNKNYQTYYFRDLNLKHPYPVPTHKIEFDYDKMCKYYVGIGALYKKHLSLLHNKRMIYLIVRMYCKLWIKKILITRSFRSKDITEFSEFVKGLSEF